MHFAQQEPARRATWASPGVNGPSVLRLLKRKTPAAGPGLPYLAGSKVLVALSSGRLLVQGQQRPGESEADGDDQGGRYHAGGAAGLPNEASAISRVTICQAAIDPAATPKTAVASPIIRYSNA